MRGVIVQRTFSISPNSSVQGEKHAKPKRRSGSVAPFRPCYKVGVSGRRGGNATSRHDPSDGRRARVASRILERARRLGLARVDAREDDPVAGVQARIARRIEHADRGQALGPRGARPRERRRASTGLRQRRQRDRPAVLARGHSATPDGLTGASPSDGCGAVRSRRSPSRSSLLRRRSRLRRSPRSRPRARRVPRRASVSSSGSPIPGLASHPPRGRRTGGSTPDAPRAALGTVGRSSSDASDPVGRAS